MPGGQARHPKDVAFAVAACATLAWYNNVAGQWAWHRRWYPVVNAGAAVAALTAATASGLTAGDLGLRPDRLRAGLRLGAAAAAPVTAAYGAAVLTPAARRVLTEPAATVTASAMFGIWHIRPTVEALDGNERAQGRIARVAAVTAVVAGTAAGGALLSFLRDRSGSLAAPAMVHLATNCTGALAGAAAARLDRRAGSRRAASIARP